MRPNGGRGALIAAALCALVYGSATLDAQEPVVSAGGNLVEGQVLNETLSARRTLEVFRRPEREFLFPMFWKEPVPAGHVDRGEAVLVIGVGETYLWRDRLVWLHLQRISGVSTETFWFRIGPQEWASSAVWQDWDKAPPDGEDITQGATQPSSENPSQEPS